MANSPSTGKSPEKQKRKKKTLRACHHCQKAHLTCDERRPCLRCVKRGLADTCADGARKKAKYLRDYEEALLAQSSSRAGIGTEDVSPSTTNNHNEHSFGLIDANPVAPFDSTSLSAGLDVNPAHAPQVGPVGPSPTTTAEQGPNLVPFFSSTDFGSEAAGFEYAILSSMLTGGGFPSSSDSPGSSNYLAGGQSSTADAFGPVPTSTADPSPFPEFPMSASTGPTDPSPLFTASNPPNGPSPFPSSVAPPAIPPHSPSHQSRPPHHPPQSPSQMRTKVKRAEKAEGSDEVYRKVTRPYRYTDSYHFLIRHLKERFEKNDILRVVRALAIYRPSLIALQMPLTEEDEIFVEKCFQRTIIELERLISFSGTPTVVWRRTGEIACVGVEFCLLTEWSSESLVGRKKFIYELFDTSSTVEYYEAFATHAFENTTQAVMTTCVLLTPKGRPVPCTFCFTIKRDLFNCPSLVIGSFLPILSA